MSAAAVAVRWCDASVWARPHQIQTRAGCAGTAAAGPEASDACHLRGKASAESYLHQAPKSSNQVRVPDQLAIRIAHGFHELREPNACVDGQSLAFQLKYESLKYRDTYKHLPYYEASKRPPSCQRAREASTGCVLPCRFNRNDGQRSYSNKTRGSDFERDNHYKTLKHIV